MTTKELIKLLQKTPPDNLVYLATDGEGNSYGDIDQDLYISWGTTVIYPNDTFVDFPGEFI